MSRHEAVHGVAYDIVMTHDAEDLVDPDSLRMVNWFSRDYAMVQVSVLVLPRLLAEFTHGLYCDEFAEYQTKDIPVRHPLGGSPCRPMAWVPDSRASPWNIWRRRAAG